jgi:hypothetical protein
LKRFEFRKCCDFVFLFLRFSIRICDLSHKIVSRLNRSAQNFIRYQNAIKIICVEFSFFLINCFLISKKISLEFLFIMAFQRYDAGWLGRATVGLL